ncbi:MAG: NAD(P)H-binding protein [Paucibacter sp.]|nr:NAD(P)H-binding protein [Roseateles sp.]
MNQRQPCVWLAGATGLVGRTLLTQLLGNPVQVEVLLRRSITDLPAGQGLQLHLVDFSKADLGTTALSPPQAVYICLGSTIAAAGSQAAFRAVDLDAVLNVARAAQVAGARRCAVVSALGADATSKVFYNRVKGEMEEAMAALRFERLVIARPSLLAGERARLGQAKRSGEAWALRLTEPFRALIPAKWRPVQAEVVARALILAIDQDGPALQVLESNHLQTLGAP